MALLGAYVPTGIMGGECLLVGLQMIGRDELGLRKLFLSFWVRCATVEMED